MRSIQLPRGPAARRNYRRLPQNHLLPLALRRRGCDSSVLAPLERDVRLARVEAALFAADEPLVPRKLAVVAEVPDLPELRRLVQRLQDYYDQDDSPFQVEEIAGG